MNVLITKHDVLLLGYRVENPVDRCWITLWRDCCKLRMSALSPAV
jgi:hypothetical protein